MGFFFSSSSSFLLVNFFFELSKTSVQPLHFLHYHHGICVFLSETETEKKPRKWIKIKSNNALKTYQNQ